MGLEKSAIDLIKLNKKHTAMAGFINGITTSSKILVVLAFKDLAASIIVLSKESKYPINNTAFKDVKPKVWTDTIPQSP